MLLLQLSACLSVTFRGKRDLSWLLFKINKRLVRFFLTNGHIFYNYIVRLSVVGLALLHMDVLVLVFPSKLSDLFKLRNFVYW